MLLEHKVPQLMTPQGRASIVSEVSALKAKQLQQVRRTEGQVSNTPVIQVNGNSMNGYHIPNGHL